MYFFINFLPVVSRLDSVEMKLDWIHPVLIFASCEPFRQRRNEIRLNSPRAHEIVENTPLIIARTQHNDLEVSLTQIMWINVCIQTSVTLMPRPQTYHKHSRKIDFFFTSNLLWIYWFSEIYWSCVIAVFID